MKIELIQKLQEVRNRLRMFHGMRGLAMVLIVMFGFAWVSLLIDTALPLASAFRWVMLVAGVVCAAGALAVWFLFPLFRPIWDDEIALLIEVSHPSLKDRLISTLQLKRSDLPEDQVGSFELIRALEEQTAAVMHPLEVKQSVRFHQLRKLYLSAAALIGLMGLLHTVRPDYIATWWIRFWDPYSDITLTNTKLDLTPKGALVPQGESFALNALAYQPSGPLEKVDLYTQFTGEKWVPLKMSRVDDKNFGHTFPEVHRDFRYYAKAGDAKTYTYDVKVVPRPAIMGVTIKYTYPSYTRKSPKEDRGDGVIEAIKGTTIDLVARASTDLKTAEIDFLLGEEKINLPLSVKDNEAHGRFTVRGSGSYSITVVSRVNLANKEKFERPIHATEDLLPVVAIPIPGSDQKCTPTAVVELLATASDDFALSDRGFLKAVKENTENAKPTTSNFAWTRPDKERQNYVESNVLLQLGGLGGLQPGDSIKYWAEARDNNPSGTGLGKSEDYKIQIVSEDEKNADFDKQIQDIFQKVSELVREQNALTQTTDRLRKKNMEDPTVKGDVLVAERKQDEITKAMEDIGQSFRRLEQDRKNNKMTPDDAMKRLKDFQRQSDQLSRQDMPNAEQKLSQARQEQHSQQAKNHMQQAHQQEEKNLDQLKKLQQQLEEQAKWAKLNDALDQMIEKETQLKAGSEKLEKDLFAADFDPAKMTPESKDQQEQNAQKQGDLGKQFKEFQKTLDQEAKKTPELQPAAQKAQGEPNVAQTMKQAQQNLEKSNPSQAKEKQQEAIKAMKDIKNEIKEAQAKANREPTPAEIAQREAEEAKAAAKEAEESAKDAEKAADRAEELAKDAAKEAEKRPNAKEQAKKTEQAAKKSKEAAKAAKDAAQEAQEGSKEAQEGEKEAKEGEQKDSKSQAKKGEKKAKEGNKKAQEAAQKAKEAKEKAEEEEAIAKEEKPKSPFEVGMEKLWEQLNAVCEAQKELKELTDQAATKQTAPKTPVEPKKLSDMVFDSKDPLAIQQLGTKKSFEKWEGDISRFVTSFKEGDLTDKEKKAHGQMQQVLTTSKDIKPGDDMKISRSYLGRTLYAQATPPEKETIAKLEELLYEAAKDKEKKEKEEKDKEKKEEKDKEKKEKEEKEEDLAWFKKKPDDGDQQDGEPQDGEPQEGDPQAGDKPGDQPGDQPGPPGDQPGPPGDQPGPPGDKPGNTPGAKPATAFHTMGGKASGPGEEVKGLLGDWAKLPPRQLERLVETRLDTLPTEYGWREGVKQYFMKISEKMKKK